MQSQIQTNISTISSQNNFDYFQMVESNIRKDNNSLVSEKSKKYILAKDIKKYENEQKLTQTTDQQNSLLGTSAAFTDRSNYFSVEQKNDKVNTYNSIIGLKGIQNQNKQPIQNQKNFLSPLDVQKNRVLTIGGSTDVKKTVSLTVTQGNIQKNSEKKGLGEDSNNLSVKNSLQSCKQDTAFQVSKFIGPNPLTQDDRTKEKNIFLEKNNPINHSMYKEFNVGPRIDNSGKLVNYTLVGQPQWYMKQKEMQEKQLSKARRASQFQKESFSKGEDENKSAIKRQMFQTKNSSSEYNQNNSFAKLSIHTDKSFVMRPDTTQSVIKQQVQPKKKTMKRNESQIEVSKDDLLRDIKLIEERHQQSTLMEQKLINDMPLEQKNIITREERVLDNYQKHLHDWDKQIKQLAILSQRQPTDSCMLRGEQHRRKVEYAQAFDNLKTEDERFGKRIWYMYLRKYPKDKKQEQDDQKPHKRTYTEDINKKSNDEDPVQVKKSKVVLNLPSIEDQYERNKQKVKLKDLIDTKENTQSDIFSGFMTVTIFDQNKEIEVIRNAQDPNNFHLSSSSAFSAYKRTSSQFYIESKVRESQQKLKGKMVILEQPINDFIVVGKNKFEEEKKQVLQSKNKQFIKMVQGQPEEYTANKRYSMQSSQSKDNFHTMPIPQKQNNYEIISQDYNINELSRSGQYFFPSFIEKLEKVSTKIAS
ncbi:hypothetical protein TTHERM_00852900 (macronuclear) [Tetrahymena thermophila SB210]|uniref:Uncharacterized protein n=1 Tax=Tetrahymena thermophila (strain SB210) TaxID=312017 RepID=Q24E50_TETTS|nr:hypothetical protein TTHERM_00852900 [Tetrahymena thermophila SB210]EAS06051.2 hypothetical protein TTHERM_00852900 [Tetrahymena thermophila SB210]|eukprot:XP_001026296.2 hypothetical protein TTHERM_00852900 [Tetrahymena thermophila SB210]